MDYKDRYGTDLKVGDRVTDFSWKGGHGIIDRFGSRYVYVRLVTAAFPEGDGRVITTDPDNLRSGWHGHARNADQLTGTITTITAEMLGFAVDDGLITLDQARAITNRLGEYGHRHVGPTGKTGALRCTPAPVPARDDEENRT